MSSLNYLRVNQAMLTYGPGAFYILPDRTTVMISPDLNNWYKIYDQNKFKNVTSESGMERAKITNSRLGAILGLDYLLKPPIKAFEDNPKCDEWCRKIPLFYEIFPKTAICKNLKCQKLTLINDSRQPNVCPVCNEKTRIQLPFILADEKGTAEEVPWTSLFQNKVGCNCGTEHIKVDMSAGYSVGKISCEICEKSTTLSVLMGDKKNIILTTSSSAYCPLTVDAINLNNALLLNISRLIREKKNQWDMMNKFPASWKDRFSLFFMHNPEILQLSEKYDDKKLETIIDQSLAYGDNERSIRQGEWDVLSGQLREENPSIVLEDFIKGKQYVTKFSCLDFCSIDRLSSVDSLEITRAFVGFKRLNNSSLVTANKSTGEAGIKQLFKTERIPDTNKWLPGIDTYGEGIFLSLDENHLSLWEKNEKVIEKIKELKEAQNATDKKYERVSDIYITPRLVLLHTLAHILIKQIAFSCGYNEASLKERLYADEEMAGILIYTANGDGEGSLGGLSSLAHPEKFNVILENALNKAAWCSADPICSESNAEEDRVNLAACHCCTLLPETCCEHFNSCLDRNLWNRYCDYSFINVTESIRKKL